VRLFSQSITPEKSVIETIRKGKGIEQRIKYINKKGTFQLREQCSQCKHYGKVQLGLGYNIFPSCDREEGFWKELKGKTDKPCKYFAGKGAV
jgi:hypothetical protein